MSATIDVRYTCDRCGAVDVVVACSVRGPEETTAAWMWSVQRTLGLHHELRRAPGCAATEVSAVKVPVSKREGARFGDP